MEAAQDLDSDVSEQFRHEAFLYRGQDDLVAGMATFVRESLAASEPIMLALPPRKTALLRDDLREDLDGRDQEVLFVDITELGRNPGRIIPACRDFLVSRQETAKRVRGAGEPMWAGRSHAEAREVQRHEALIGQAFGGPDSLWLLCAYDVRALTADVVEEAYRVHPYVLEAGGPSAASTGYQPNTTMPAHLDTALSPPPATARSVEFGRGELSPLRRLVTAWAHEHGMPSQRIDLLVLAVNELTTNSVEHGGGSGRLVLWTEDGSLVAEVRDAGHIPAPLVGRVRPDQQQGGGRGVWLVNQVCDLVEIRSHPEGTVVRVRMARGGPHG